MQQDRAERLWATVGKLGVIVGVALGLVNLYQFMLPDGPRLTCRCDFTEIDSEVFRRVSNARLTEIIGPRPESAAGEAQTKDKSANDVETLKANAKKPPTPREVAELLRSEFQTGWGGSYSDRAVITCILSNTGSKEAKDTELVFPQDIDGGYFRADDVRQDMITDASRRVVRLGSVRAGGSIQITAWGGDTFFYRLDGTNLTHSEGRGTVTVARPVYGLLATLKNDKWLLSVLSTLMLIAGLIGAKIGTLLRQRKLSAAVQPASQAPVGDNNRPDGRAG